MGIVVELSCPEALIPDVIKKGNKKANRREEKKCILGEAIETIIRFLSDLRILEAPCSSQRVASLVNNREPAARKAGGLKLFNLKVPVSRPRFVTRMHEQGVSTQFLPLLVFACATEKPDHNPCSFKSSVFAWRLAHSYLTFFSKPNLMATVYLKP